MAATWLPTTGRTEFSAVSVLSELSGSQTTDCTAAPLADPFPFLISMIGLCGAVLLTDPLSFLASVIGLCGAASSTITILKVVKDK
jgi:hypothetical protein